MRLTKALIAEICKQYNSKNSSTEALAWVEENVELIWDHILNNVYLKNSEQLKKSWEELPESWKYKVSGFYYQSYPGPFSGSDHYFYAFTRHRLAPPHAQITKVYLFDLGFHGKKQEPKKPLHAILPSFRTVEEAVEKYPELKEIVEGILK